MAAANPFDADSLRLEHPFVNGTGQRAKPTPPPHHKTGEKFLRGPIPWAWLKEATDLPGKALALALHVWREAGWQKRRTVKLNLSRIDLKLSKYAARRALQALERAKLVVTHREPGHGIEVTILNLEEA
jgi:hypothetical protein